MEITISSFDFTSFNKLLKERLLFYPNYGFFYIVSCDHWILENKNKCYKFGITSQCLEKRFLSYDNGNFGRLTLYACYACTNAKKLEDTVKQKVFSHVKKGKEWVDLELNELRKIVESLVIKNELLKNPYKIDEFNLIQTKTPTPLTLDEDINLNELSILIRNQMIINESSMTPPINHTNHLNAHQLKFVKLNQNSKDLFPPLAKPRKKKQIKQINIKDSKDFKECSNSNFLLESKNIRFDQHRKCYVASVQYQYCRQSKTFSIKQYGDNQIAFEHAQKWQSQTLQKLHEQKQCKKRIFQLDPMIEKQVQRLRGIRIDKHNGAFIVFLQRNNISLRKAFSYRKKDRNPQHELQRAVQYRQEILSQPFELFCKSSKTKTNRKRKKME